jgi:hypothetical protein
MVLKLEHIGKWIRSTLKVMKCGAGEGWKDQLDRSFEKLGSFAKCQGKQEHTT